MIGGLHYLGERRVTKEQARFRALNRLVHHAYIDLSYLILRCRREGEEVFGCLAWFGESHRAYCMPLVHHDLLLDQEIGRLSVVFEGGEELIVLAEDNAAGLIIGEPWHFRRESREGIVIIGSREDALWAFETRFSSFPLT